MESTPLQPRLVEIVSPSALPQGFQFAVQVEGETLTVEMPHATKQGETVKAIVLKKAWKVGIFDCFHDGLFHNASCLVCWCNLCALGQVLERVGLNWTAQREGSGACRVWLWIALVFMAISSVLSAIIQSGTDVSSYQYSRDTDFDFESDFDVNLHREPYAKATNVILQILTNGLYLFSVLVLCRLRGAIRRRQHIEGDEISDLACSCCCHPCVTCQVARQTADYDRQVAYCCTKTGLVEDSQVPVAQAVIV